MFEQKFIQNIGALEHPNSMLEITPKLETPQNYAALSKDEETY